MNECFLLLLLFLFLFLFRKSESPFRIENKNAFYLCTGTQNGRIAAYDVLNFFKCETQVDLKGQLPVLALEHVTCELALPSKDKDKSPKEKEALGVQSSVIVASSGCDLVLVSTKTWSCLYTIEEAHKNEIQALGKLFIENHAPMLVSCALDTSIVCWDTSSWTKLFALQGHEDAVVAMAVMPPEKNGPSSTCRLCTGSDDAKIMVWDVAKMCSTAQGKGKGGTGKTSGKEPDGEAESVPEYEPEHTLTKHTDFIGSLCITSIDNESDSSRKDYLLSASADFSICVWDRSWTCVRVLDSDTFVFQLSVYGHFLFATYRSGIDLDEGSLVTWSISDPNPVKWKKNTGKPKQIIPPIALITEPIDPFRYCDPEKVPKSIQAAKKKTQLTGLILTAAEDTNLLQIWNCPFKCPFMEAPLSPTLTPALPADVPENTNSKSVTKKEQQSSEKVDQGSVLPSTVAAAAAKPAPTTASATARSTGDLLAKKFIGNILELEHLSPDMKRILQTALHLHSP